jgi:hypothetical protein
MKPAPLRSSRSAEFAENPSGGTNTPERGPDPEVGCPIPNLLDDHEEISLDPDVYDASFFSITFDSYELFTGLDRDGISLWVNVYRMFFTLLLLLANYALQLGLLCWISMFVALPSVHRAQTVYQSYHAVVFEQGEFQQHLWEAWEPERREALCSVAFSQYWFMFAILSIWWITMSNEVKRTMQLFFRIADIPSTGDIQEMLCRVDEPERKNFVMKLTVNVRIVLNVTLVIPKLAIALLLLTVGTVWLAATDSYSDLVLNSVALGFVINIDELIFEGLIPQTMKNNIAITKVWKGGEAEDKLHEDQIKRAYRDATLIFLTVVLGVAFYMSSYGQSIPWIGIFPKFNHDDLACPSWWSERTKEVCTRGQNCFPFG